MVAPELKLTKKVTFDKEGTRPPLPRIVVERIREAGRRRFYVLSADIEPHGHTGGCPGCAALASHGRATKPHNNESRDRIRTIIERTLTGKARMSAYKDRVAQTERLKERKRARVERGAGDVLVEPGIKSRCRIDIRSHLAKKRENTKRTERVMSTLAKKDRRQQIEEQPDRLRKTVRFEQEAPNTSSSSSTPCVS